VRFSSVSEGQRPARGLGIRIAVGILAALTLVLLTTALLFHATLSRLVERLQTTFVRADGCAGCRELPVGTAVARLGQPVAQVVQVAAAHGAERPLPMYLARGRGPVLDSLHAGRLAARMDPALTAAGYIPLIELVPLDSVRGRTVEAQLVISNGGSPVAVFGGPSTSRP
jgi:hypothetical protein